MNATYTVNVNTRHVMLTELEKAAAICKAISDDPSNPNLSWKRLFKKFPFFKAFNHFIEIQILSKHEDAH